MQKARRLADTKVVVDPGAHRHQGLGFGSELYPEQVVRLVDPADVAMQVDSLARRDDELNLGLLRHGGFRKPLKLDGHAAAAEVAADAVKTLLAEDDFDFRRQRNAGISAKLVPRHRMSGAQYAHDVRPFEWPVE